MVEDSKFNSDNFNLSTDMKVFIDMGHDTMKVAQITDDNWSIPLNHFEIPTVLLAELVSKQKKLLQKAKYDFDRKVNTNFKFYKNNIDKLVEHVLSITDTDELPRDVQAGGASYL